jgi:hypothetical protein
MRPNYLELCAACHQPTYWHRLSEGGAKHKENACDLIFRAHLRAGEKNPSQIKRRTGFGYHSNNKFCTETCAYNWALKQAQ